MVRDISEAVELPGLEARALRLPLSIPGLPGTEAVAVLGPGIVGSSADAAELKAPPTLGQHTAEIIDWLDCD
jgi:crotonobetainyl-CoA:carnitine CoA-transferase CaiB-like acyl-CoA transferase